MGNSQDRNPFAGLGAVVLVGYLGLVVAVPIVLGVLAGVYLDDRLGETGLVLILFILLGIVSGIYNGYRVVARWMNQ